MYVSGDNMAKKKITKAKLKKMGKIVGVVALIGVGALAVRALAGKQVIVQYGHVNDENFAEALASKFKGKLVKDPLFGWDDQFGRVDKPIIFVGGQFANPAVNNLMSLGIFDTVTQDSSGTVQVGKVRGFNAYLVAGWTSADTQGIVDALIKRGLPSRTKSYF